TYPPHVDTGCLVIVINAEKVLLTGSKDTGKIYESFSGYRSGHKLLTADVVRAKNPIRMIKEAVWGMLPKGRLGRQQYSKMKIYAGAEHPHAAQNPETVKF
ncbi:MAG: 50S ribosomal protein L13, partial [Lentisphaeria bacterium]|nr:50S ribosomal protein L13 [Lentisphaeria bacterium]